MQRRLRFSPRSVTMIPYCYSGALMRINLRVGAIAGGGKDASDSIRDTAAACENVGCVGFFTL